LKTQQFILINNECISRDTYAHLILNTTWKSWIFVDAFT